MSRVTCETALEQRPPPPPCAMGLRGEGQSLALIVCPLPLSPSRRGRGKIALVAVPRSLIRRRGFLLALWIMQRAADYHEAGILQDLLRRCDVATRHAINDPLVVPYRKSR